MSSEAKRFSETGKDIESKFRFAVSAGIEHALSLTKQRFETPGLKDRQIYHIRPHIQGVIFRTASILKAINEVAPELVTKRDIALGMLAAAWHDEDQDWQSKTEKDAEGREIRKRERQLGINEAKSGNKLVKYMLATNEQMNDEIFTPGNMQAGQVAIALTEPKFVNGTVIHPDFDKRSDNLVAQAVVLADIGGGMEPFPTTKWETDAIFLEDEIDIADCVFKNPALEPEDEEWYRARVLARLVGQSNFYEGRKKRIFEHDIPSMAMDPHVQKVVKDLFKYFPTTLSEIKKLHKKRTDMSFAQLKADILESLKKPPEYDLSEFLTT